MSLALGLFWYQETRVLPYTGSMNIWRGMLYLGVAAVIARAGKWACFGVAGIFVVLKLLPAIYDLDQVSLSVPEFGYHLPIVFDDFAAVLNGLTPAVDYLPLYSKLLPMVLAPWFKVVGLSILSYTLTLTALSAVLLGLIYSMLRSRIPSEWGKRGEWVGLIAFFAVLALSTIPMGTKGSHRYFLFNYFSIMPMRMLFPLLLGWLISRGTETSRKQWWIFSVAAIGLVDSLEFALPAFVSAMVAVYLSEKNWRALIPAGAALLGAGVLFSVWTLLRSGQTPDWQLFTFFLRMFPRYGLMMLPLPPMGLHWLFVLTYLACVLPYLLSPRRPVDALSVYVGLFGLGSFTYYVGRSHPQVLMALFPIWGLALGIVGIRALQYPSKPGRFVFGLGLLFFAGLFVSALRDIPMREFGRRMRESDPQLRTTLDARVEELRALGKPGVRVLLLENYGHWVALKAGVKNVFPYSAVEGVVMVKDQARWIRDVAVKNGIDRYYGAPIPELREALEREGIVEVKRAAPAR